jgi:hypothetical protein
MRKIWPGKSEFEWENKRTIGTEVLKELNWRGGMYPFYLKNMAF